MAHADDGTPDRVLAVAAMLGDLDAFDVLVRRYRPAAVRTAERIVGRDGAEDVAQEALLLAFRALPALEEPGKFAAWLHAITRRCALRARARAGDRRRVALDELLAHEIPALRPGLPGASGGEELRRELESITPDHALVLRLHFLDGMPLKRIAGYLGVPLSTVKWRIHRGKRLLRERLGKPQGRGESWTGKRKSES